MKKYVVGFYNYWILINEEQYVRLLTHCCWSPANGYMILEYHRELFNLGDEVIIKPSEIIYIHAEK